MTDKLFELDIEKFFSLFPKRAEDAYKGSFGKILMVSGGRGMAGAASLNLLGAKALGAQYILMAIPEEIYSVVAPGSITTVYYPYALGDGPKTVKQLLKKTVTKSLRSVSDASSKEDTAFEYSIILEEALLVKSADEDAASADSTISDEFLFKKSGKIRSPKHLSEVRAVCFGSGAVELSGKYAIFNLLASNCGCTLVLDAEALNIMNETAQVDFNIGNDRPVIITPHIGEFCTVSGLFMKDIDLSGSGTDAADKHHAELAVSFSAKNNLITVLKGPHTVVGSPDGRYYINRTGNQGLAQAGSGDVLTGMITAMCSFINDPFEAACMGVFAHGLAADELCNKHSKQCMPLDKIPEAMDRLFFEHAF